MSKKTPYNRELFDEWDPIAFNRDKLTLDQRVAAWQELWDKYCPTGRPEMPAFDACLLTGLGESLAMQSGDYKKAIELCDIFLALPDAKTQETDFELHHIWRGCALIADGKADQGVGELRPLLKGHLGKYETRNNLIALLPTLKDKNAFPVLRKFVVDLLNILPKCEKLAKRADTARSFSDLYRLVREAADKTRIT